jgi:predicted DNA-binding transcriptional regulator AlpA
MSMETPPKRLLSLKDMTKVYGMTVWFWRTAIWRGDLPHLQLGRKLAVDARDVDEWIERKKVIEGVC